MTTMIRRGVAIDGVNIMTMDFGSLPAGQSMRSGIQHAIEATQVQLGLIYRQAGVMLTPRQVSNERMGATPMIGRNDVQGETFTPSDAHALVSFAPPGAPRPHLDVVGEPRLAVRRPVARRPGLEHVQRRRAAAARVHLGARQAGRPPAGPHDRSGAAGCVAHPDPGRSGHEPLPDLACVQELPRRRGDRVAPPRLRGEVVHAGRRPGRAGQAPLGYAVALPRPDPGERRRERRRDPGARQLERRSASTSRAASVLYNGLVYEAKWWTQADVPSAGLNAPGDAPWAIVAAKAKAVGVQAVKPKPKPKTAAPKVKHKRP